MATDVFLLLIDFPGFMIHPYLSVHEIEKEARAALRQWALTEILDLDWLTRAPRSRTKLADAWADAGTEELVEELGTQKGVWARILRCTSYGSEEVDLVFSPDRLEQAISECRARQRRALGVEVQS
jgi:hypothetical protein